MKQHSDFVHEAQSLFGGSTVVHEVTFDGWFSWLRGQIKKAIWPGAPRTCRGCQGLGCRYCERTGRVLLGASNEEEELLEVATRLLLNARYYCPTEQLPWMDLAIDTFCARWHRLYLENKPP